MGIGSIARNATVRRNRWLALFAWWSRGSNDDARNTAARREARDAFFCDAKHDAQLVAQSCWRDAESGVGKGSAEIAWCRFAMPMADGCWLSSACILTTGCCAVERRNLYEADLYESKR